MMSWIFFSRRNFLFNALLYPPTKMLAPLLGYDHTLLGTDFFFKKSIISLLLLIYHLKLDMVMMVFF